MKRTLTDEIEEILQHKDGCNIAWGSRCSCGTEHSAKEIAKTVRDYTNEVIGEDRQADYSTFDGDPVNVAINFEKEQQRKRAEELLGSITK